MSSKKANDLLKALNSQIQHQETGKPSPPNPPPSEQTPEKQHTQPSRANREEQITEGMPQQTSQEPPFNQELKYEETKETPEFLVEILLKQIGEEVTESTSEAVESLIREREKNAYDSYTKADNEYIKVLFEHVHRKDADNLSKVSDLMSARADRVEGQVLSGRLSIDLQRKISNKKQFEYLQKVDVARLIKIKDGQLRSKMDILNDKMNVMERLDDTDLGEDEKLVEEQVRRRVAQNMDAQNYLLSSEKTKIAREYVKHMHHQRRLHQKRKQERDSRYEAEEETRKTELKEAMKLHDEAKRKEIIDRIQKRRQRLDAEERQIKQKEEQVSKFLSKYHRKLPIFKIREKEFIERIVKPEEKVRNQRLKEIRDNRRSLSLNEIKSHQQKYMSHLEIQRGKKAQQMKLISKQRQSQNLRKPYYQGSAHSRMEQMTKQEVLRKRAQREANKLKAHRMKEYSGLVSKSHRPTIDQEKRKKLLDFIQEDEMRKKHAKKVYRQVIDEQTSEVRFQHYYEEVQKKDRYKEGNKLFEEAKKAIKRKPKHEEKSEEEDIEPEKSMSAHSPSPSRIRLLGSQEEEKEPKSVWNIRAKQLSQMTHSDIVDAQKFELIKRNIQNLDGKAASKEVILKHGNLSINEHIDEKGKLDQYYLESIKNKMKLLE